MPAAAKEAATAEDAPTRDPPTAATALTITSTSTATTMLRGAARWKVSMRDIQAGSGATTQTSSRDGVRRRTSWFSASMPTCVRRSEAVDQATTNQKQSGRDEYPSEQQHADEPEPREGEERVSVACGDQGSAAP